MQMNPIYYSIGRPKTENSTYKNKKYIRDPGINWSIIKDVDPIMLSETKDFNLMEKIANSFVSSIMNEGDRSYLSDPLAFKFVMILQIIIQYMYDCQKQLKTKLTESEDECLIYKEKINLLQRSENRKDILLKEAYTDYDKCPLCRKKFKSLNLLDKHIEKQHSTHFYAWKSIRVNASIDPKSRIKELEEEISTIRTTMNEQTKKFNESLINFNNRLEAKKRDNKQKKQVQKPIIEYFEFHPKQSKQENEIKPNTTINPFKQHVLHIDADPSSDFDSSDLDVDEHMRRIEKKSKKEVNRIHNGFGSNYVTPKQAENMLKLNNVNYKRVHASAKEQIEKEFPMAQSKQKRKKPSSHS